ncbi:hypothetical protein [Halohasta salina]|uniref:hypothetical protein n=1 Tax=Halohasta salina TaxID=2961621 RepID=UPI0020A368ED|nr:hypothetical protein [Halohasta salina]
MTDQPPTVQELLDESNLKKLNVASLLVQAGHAQRSGDTRRAALLFGTALVAPKYSGVSYVVQGALTANDLRKKLGSGS